ncbi:hypothetical protein EW093_00860 [Thiospirochaeta perfilievii]|uniref:Uncharacterized protein n=1 Tax=Thiospirochaeta perfilievii TaxID=252967 RepID=A0A5C1Q5H8_9SPIO|nr:FHIPEP family type III secretion protein [Thiospirochaeta perfilievii]QEN03313.1 hypothetical protein EW093_00860 [Thiospirochaeta perfilievii]
MNKLLKIQLIIGIVIIFSLILTTPQTIEMFKLLIGMALTILIVITIGFKISNKIPITIAPTLFFLDLLVVVAIKIKFIYFISTIGSVTVSTYTDYIVNYFVILIIGFIMSVLSVFVLSSTRKIIEVCARFNIDALPGRQMSIEVDYNSGVITEDEERDKKITLQKQVNLFFALDGVVNFITLSSTFGSIITGVTIVVRSLIETLQFNTTFVHNLKIYIIPMILEIFIFHFILMLLAKSVSIYIRKIMKENYLSINRY